MNAKVLAAISVTANVALLAVALRPGRGPAAGSAAPGGGHPPAGDIVRIKTNLTRVELTETNEAPSFHWASVHSEDLEEFAANLLAVDCPPETVRAIIESEAWQQFLPRRRLLLEPVHRQYWNLAASGSSFDKAADSVREELNKLKKETIDKLDGIVGGEVAAEKERRTPMPIFDFLPAEKQRAVEELKKTYDEEIQVLTKALKATPKPTPELKAKREQLTAQLNKGIRALMTPEELVDYELRESAYSGKARSSIGFEPTLDESREVTRIYKLSELADAKIDRKAPDVEARKAETAAAKKQREESLKQSLGEERYAQFKQGEDSNFGEIYRITERYELPREAATGAAAALKARNEALGRLRKGTNPQEREERTMALNVATRAEMLSVLGERALRTYEKYHGPIIPVPEPDTE